MQNPDMIEFLKYALDLEQDFTSGNYRLGWEDSKPDSASLAAGVSVVDQHQQFVIVINGIAASDRPLKSRLNETLQDGHKLIQRLPREEVDLALRLVSAITGGPVKVVMGEVVNQFVAQTVGEDLARVQMFMTEQAAEYLNDKPDGYYQISPEEKRQLGVSAEIIASTQQINEAELGAAELGMGILGATTGIKILKSNSKGDSRVEKNTDTDAPKTTSTQQNRTVVSSDTNTATDGNAASNSPSVIGENMKRVNQYAKDVNGQTIDDWLDGREWTQQLNDEFIATMKAEGRDIKDIGPDFSRRLINRIDSSQGRNPSAVYGTERRDLLDYDRYEQLYERTGKYQGGIPGFDKTD
ncbi:MAG: hypothetical protein HKO67_14690 [Flavobacteriaceae bacterium]|nr:hypothetical protein [Flavobacteriaceae bacterium]